MAINVLNELREAGCPVDLLTVAQKQVLESLTEDELKVLLTVQRRLSAAGSDVEGQQEMKLL